VFIPTVTKRTKQSRHLIRFRIKSGNIWPFVSAAVLTGQRQIRFVVTAAVL